MLRAKKVKDSQGQSEKHEQVIFGTRCKLKLEIEPI